MKPESGDGQNESPTVEWLRVPKIASLEFEQSYAVAQLAIKLLELKKATQGRRWRRRISIRKSFWTKHGS